MRTCQDQIAQINALPGHKVRTVRINKGIIIYLQQYTTAHSIPSDVRQQCTNELSLVAREVRVKHIHDQDQARSSSDVHRVFKAVVEYDALTCTPMSGLAVHCNLRPTAGS